MSHPGRPAASQAPIDVALDLREKGGPKDGEQQFSSRRLFMQLTAFTGCRDSHKLAGGLGAHAGVDYVLYEEVGDPTGAAVLAMTEDPALLVSKVRRDLQTGPFAELTMKPEFAMLGRTYSLGYEPKLEDWLLDRPRRVTADPATPWAIWYPLRRSGSFSRLPRPEQMQILKEHGTIGRQFGDAGVATDVRLACHGLDKNDNDFVIGLVGEGLVTTLLLPAFFALVGMRTEIGLVSGWQNWLVCLVIIAVATLGKFGGTWAAARVVGKGWREAASLGILMNTRGLMELIVLNIGLDLGVISPTLFAMMVLMALVTTVATSPILYALMPRLAASTSLAAEEPIHMNR